MLSNHYEQNSLIKLNDYRGTFFNRSDISRLGNIIEPYYDSIKIIIDSNKMIIGENVESKTNYSVYDAEIELMTSLNTAKNIIKLSNFNQTNETLSQLSESKNIVLFFFEENKFLTQLPANMNANLIEFLKKHNPSADTKYSCLHFAYEMMHGRQTSQKKCEQNNVKTFPAFPEEQSLIPGDVVYLSQEKKFHFAIFIGNGHYLSMFGQLNNKSGPLLITTLGEMMKAFRTTSYAKVISLELSDVDMSMCLNKWEQDYNQEFKNEICTFRQKQI